MPAADEQGGQHVPRGLHHVVAVREVVDDHQRLRERLGAHGCLLLVHEPLLLRQDLEQRWLISLRVEGALLQPLGELEHR